MKHILTTFLATILVACSTPAPLANQEPVSPAPQVQAEKVEQPVAPVVTEPEIVTVVEEQPQPASVVPEQSAKIMIVILILCVIGFLVFKAQQNKKTTK
jgi:hypothetical protein